MADLLLDSAAAASGCAVCCGASTACVVRVCFCSACCSPADARASGFCESLACRVFCCGRGLATEATGVFVCFTITLAGESGGGVSAASCGCCACPVLRAACCCADFLLGGVGSGLALSGTECTPKLPCVRPQVDPGPLLSASASSISYTRISLSVSIPSPAPDRRRDARGLVTMGAITKQLTRDRSRANRNSYVQMGCMQSVVPDSLGISVSLAGRN